MRTISREAFSFTTFGGPMPETARLLRFPVPVGAPLTHEESLARAHAYLQRVRERTSEEERPHGLESRAGLQSVCMLQR